MFQFITLLLTVGHGLFSCEAKVFYVTPILPADQTCPLPCHTLEQYAQNPLLLTGHTNISLFFLEGVHNLSTELILLPDILEFRGLGASPDDTVINLPPSNIVILSVTELHLYNVRVCVDDDFTANQSFTTNGLFIYSSNLDIQNCSINVDFLSAVLNVSASINSSVTLYNTEVGGIINIYYTDQVVIRNSIFTGVLTVFSLQSLSILDCKFIGSQNFVEITRININVNNKVFIRNVTVSDAKTFGFFFVSVNNVTITESNIVNNTIGMQSINSNLKIYDTEITGNNLGVVILLTRQIFAIYHEYTKLCIKNCTVSFNNEGGLALVNTQPVVVEITDCGFYSNQGTPITAYQSTFEFQGETIFRDNTVRSGGGLTLINSTVIFGPESNTTFINNTAEEFGGAIYIVNLPTTPFAEILILNQNNANQNAFILQGFDSVGLILSGQGERCSYLLEKDSYISFVTNKATLGGYDVFGATIYTEECSFSKNSSFQFSNETLKTYKISSDPTRVCFCTNNIPQCENRNYLVLNETRYPGESFNTSIVLAGYNYGRVAGNVYTNVLGGDYQNLISENQHLQPVNLMECSEVTYQVSSHQLQTVVLVLTTQEQSTQERNEDEIGVSLRNINSRPCSRETFQSPCTALLTTPVYINVTLEACPLGFGPDKTTRVCDCDTNLAKFRDMDQAMITCMIRNRTGYITREGTVWVGVDTSESNTDIYYWHRYCQRDYCISSQTTIDLRSPDQQCSSNRAGVLCGRCRANYSLQLGGNKCLKCNNNFLALLIVFAVLGILLVVLIKLLDLTVTSGIVSGLIFYANIVWSNNAILFSLQDRQSIGYYTPIAWINLDFGIETCFIENLDQLTKTYLQFVFPVYIWCIAGLIIIISHYSTRATKLFGNNSVSVLATLFLLSYGKLFRNITDVFTFADIPDSNGTSLKVWSLDGNVRYGETAGHIGLIIVALLFLILFLLPFTLTLLLVPLLRAKSRLRLLRWIITLNPFFDAYYGPFKNKKQHQMWTGILLTSRVMILTVFASTSTYSPNANILLMTLVSMLLLMYSASVSLLYKKWYLSSLENLYILNLMILGSTFLFYQPTSVNKRNPQHNGLNPVTAASAGIALLVLLLTVIIYTARRVAEKVQTYLNRKRNEANHIGPGDTVPEAQVNLVRPTVQIVLIKKSENYDPPQWREPLLATTET